MKIKNLLLIGILIFLLFIYNINNREGFYVGGGGGGGGDTMQNMIAHRYNELLEKEKNLEDCREELQTYKDSENEL